MDVKKEIERLKDAYEDVEKNEVNISQESMPSLDFTKSRHNLIAQQYRNVAKNVQQIVSQLNVEEQEDVVKQMQSLSQQLLDQEKLSTAVKMLYDYSKQLKIPEEQALSLPSSLPSDIYPEIEADYHELNKCLNAGCHRSCVILCGRMLEVILHRKYFEATENDLLEKSPGIGLGNLIAKMKEKEISFDPGLTQQIHLINQVRIFSVHKKQEPFYPSKSQAQAMVLYTLDVMEKMF